MFLCRLYLISFQCFFTFYYYRIFLETSESFRCGIYPIKNTRIMTNILDKELGSFAAFSSNDGMEKKSLFKGTIYFFCVAKMENVQSEGAWQTYSRSLRNVLTTHGFQLSVNESSHSNCVSGAKIRA